MKWLVRTLLVLGLVAAACAASYRPATKYWTRLNRPQWRSVEVTRGRIVAVVNSTGEVKPVRTVQVGAFVSGPIVELAVEFNQEVKEGQLLAQIDTRIFQTIVKRDKAQLSLRNSEVARVTALLEQARNEEKRAQQLTGNGRSFISDSEFDKILFNRVSLEAQLEVAKASVEEATATYDNAMTNLNYARIVSPVDGIVIDRKIDNGQTVAAQFQTPELFRVAPQMREKMHIHALVDEADIGQVRRAHEHEMSVHFTVDAYPDELFEGTIEEIRFSSGSSQNVVTYPVIVAAPNPELKLLPGMTATISFQVDERTDVTKIPNAALRFFPDLKHVHPDDRKLLEGNDQEKTEDSDESQLSASERALLRGKRHERHVWVEAEGLLRAIAITTGLSDSSHTELVSGDLAIGQALVTGIKPKKPVGAK